MKDHIKKKIIKAAAAVSIEGIEVIQDLWKGYGQIIRVHLTGSIHESVVVKHVSIPHPGKNQKNNISHLRKIKSYEIETNWYKEWSSHCTFDCHVPQCIYIEKQGPEILMILEDLTCTGYPLEKYSVTWEEMKTCISWLAHFHGTFLGRKPENLWKTGTYWHLATRPEELKSLSHPQLKKAAQVIDTKLRQSPFQTIVHGDAKLANFCFSENGLQAAAVDFQYTGGGCGMKDLAYLSGSCLYEDECETMENEILDYYFLKLSESLNKNNSSVNSKEIEENWRPLYHVAWADFHRFYKGWSPGQWNPGSYSERITEKVIKELLT